MFQDFSYVKLNESHSGNMGKLSGDIIKENFNESSGISRVINLVTNSTESKVDRIIHFSDTETTDIATKKSFLKHLLIGGTILTGVGALAAGGFYYFAGRQNTSNRSENMHAPHFSAVPASVDSVLSDVSGGSSTTAGYALRPAVNSTGTPETSFSPYSYYEKIYGSSATQNQTRQLESTSTTDKPDAVSEKTNTTPKKPDIKMTSSSTSAYMATKQTYDPIIFENHDKVRSSIYNTLMADYEDPQPLGPVFHAQISDFCYSELIKPAIEQAYAGDEKQRCNLLNIMSDVIENFILDEILLIDEHDQLKELTKN